VHKNCPLKISLIKVDFLNQNFLSLEEKEVHENEFNLEGPDELNSALELRNLSSTWSADGEFAIADVSLNVRMGQLIGVIGPVGSGKVKPN